MTRSAVMLGIAAACAIAACASDPGVIAARQLPAALRGDAAAIVAANNQFAIDVLAKQPSRSNAIFSPFSMSTALAMLDAGAAGQTDAELRAALHFTLPADRTNAAYGALLTSLETGRRYGGYELATADRLFGQQGFGFLADFLSITKDDYHAPLQPVDFAGAPDASLATIDQWVAKQTDNLIPQLLQSIDVDTRLVLANAIVFEGNWKTAFDPKDTRTASFHVAGGGDVTTPIMYEDALISIAQIPGGQMGILPFRGDDLAMLVLLPDDPDGLPQLEAQLTADSIAQGVASAIHFDGKSMVALPRFALGEQQDLSVLLPTLGIVSAFTDAADLSGIDGMRDLVVQSAVHQAMITVDEVGATAAAGTGVVVIIKSAGGPLWATHSFAFAIYDNVTGSILFFGRVQDPTQP
jgi:serpin B